MSDAQPVEISPADFQREIEAGPAGRLMTKLGLQCLEVGANRMAARMPVEGNTQPYGLLHGGVTAALCETLGSIGTALHAGPDRLVTGIELNVNHLRAVRKGHVIGTGVPLHLGRTTAVWDMRVHDEEGRLVAVSRLTLAIREARSD